MTDSNNFDSNQEVEFNSAMAAFESKQFALAAQLLGPFAHDGNAEAQHRLAIMYQNGLGVAQNDTEAMKWMQAAAEQNHALAQHGMGFMYMEGECTEKDPAAAIKWFTLAAEQGLAGSQTTLAMMYEQGNGVEQNQEEAKKWYAKAGF
ncbi:hypothetical protein MNBD_GAMMA25-1884 [hydrothermal vent metagenome]|uniref:TETRATRICOPEPTIDE REPEAT FAMILY PROTEIN n=1 Tax=hydrothermal vent metagenome TaxID=652676 RepID=A0A3B1AXE8_9ZZZZ